jgi:ADP-ribose pyrophosphatase
MTRMADQPAAQSAPADRLTEHRITGERVFHGRLLDVRRDRVRLPDDNEATREYVVHPGAVLIIPRLADGHLLFERQHRYPVGRTILELPAGKIDAGEAIADTARRELREETGHIADRWRHLGTIHPCVGYSNERIEIFLADGLRRVSAPQLDAGEFLELEVLAVDEARAAVRDGRITDGKTIAALYWLDGVERLGW